jgi:hypothetical protein
MENIYIKYRFKKIRKLNESTKIKANLILNILLKYKKRIF